MFDPDKPPLWWLRKIKNQACAAAGAGLGSQQYCDCLTYFVDNYSWFLTRSTSGPGGTCMLLYGGYVYDLWARVGEQQTLLHCGLFPSNGEPKPDVLQVESLRVQFPAGTKVLSKTCVVKSLDEVCDLCPG